MPSLALWNAVVTDPSGFHGLSAGGLGEPREKLRKSPWEHREARKLMEIQHETFVEWWADWVSWVINLTDDIYIYMMHRWLYIRDLLEFPRFDSTSGAWLLCQAVERSTNSKTQSGAARLQGHRHASTICTDALWLNHHPVCGGEHVQFLGLLFSRYSHDIPIIFPWYSYDIPMIFPWYSHDIPMIFPWYSNDIPMIFLLLLYDYYY